MFLSFSLPNSLIGKAQTMQISADEMVVNFWPDEQPLKIDFNANKNIPRLLNDGQWHHVAFMWQSVSGQYTVLIDGSIFAEGEGLGKDRFLPP